MNADFFSAPSQIFKRKLGCYPFSIYIFHPGVRAPELLYPANFPIEHHHLNYLEDLEQNQQAISIKMSEKNIFISFFSIHEHMIPSLKPQFMSPFSKKRKFLTQIPDCLPTKSQAFKSQIQKFIQNNQFNELIRYCLLPITTLDITQNYFQSMIVDIAQKITHNLNFTPATPIAFTYLVGKIHYGSAEHLAPALFSSIIHYVNHCSGIEINSPLSDKLVNRLPVHIDPFFLKIYSESRLLLSNQFQPDFSVQSWYAAIGVKLSILKNETSQLSTLFNYANLNHDPLFQQFDIYSLIHLNQDKAA